MQIPYRKPGKFSQMKTDPLITKAKFDELTKDLERLKKIRPKAANDVAEYAKNGDFSENAEYQQAKARLRGINSAILRIESELNHAEIILPTKSDIVQLGSKVTVENGGKQKTYLILGSQETDPKKNIISHNSPLGSALMGHKMGDKVAIKLRGNNVEYGIINVE